MESAPAGYSACPRSPSPIELASRRNSVASMDGVKEEASFTQSDYVLDESGNEWDRRGMARIGKKQELRREFHFFSITGYAMILGCSWEFALM